MPREIKRMMLKNLLAFLSSAALCNEDANGNVPLGKSCNRYWNCQGGYPRLQRCPAMLVFDKHSLRCVVPPTEECDVIATPAPLEDQPNGGQSERGQVRKSMFLQVHSSIHSFSSHFRP